MTYELDYPEIGNRIRKFRKICNLSQEELAEAVDISATHMSHIETANTKLSLTVCASIARVLNVRLDDIVFHHPDNDNYLKNEITELISDCNDNEQKIIYDIIKASKLSIRKYIPSGNDQEL